MNISNIHNQTSFSARSPKLREADKICRLINAEFPAISGTKFAEFDTAQNNQQMLTAINAINEKLYHNIRIPFDRSYSQWGPLQGIVDLITLVKEFRIANCGEFAKLCAAICNINGIEVVQPGLTLVTKDNRLTAKNIDHAVIMFKPKKNIMLKRMRDLKDAIIIDPWLGIVDFAPNIEQKFKSEYAKFFKIPENCDIALTTWTADRIKYNEEISAKLKKLFPQFIIKKDKPLILH